MEKDSPLHLKRIPPPRPLFTTDAVRQMQAGETPEIMDSPSFEPIRPVPSTGLRSGT